MLHQKIKKELTKFDWYLVARVSHWKIMAIWQGVIVAKVKGNALV